MAEGPYAAYTVNTAATIMALLLPIYYNLIFALEASKCPESRHFRTRPGPARSGAKGTQRMSGVLCD